MDLWQRIGLIKLKFAKENHDLEDAMLQRLRIIWLRRIGQDRALGILLMTSKLADYDDSNTIWQYRHALSFHYITCLKLQVL